MKINKYLPVKCVDEAQFYRSWMEFFTPYHKLTAREKDVAARILAQYYKFKSNCQDPDVVNELLWSRSSRKDMMASLKMSQAHFLMVLAELKKSGFLKDGAICSSYLPDKSTDDPRFVLCVVFDWSSPRNPVHNAV